MVDDCRSMGMGRGYDGLMVMALVLMGCGSRCSDSMVRFGCWGHGSQWRYFVNDGLIWVLRWGYGSWWQCFDVLIWVMVHSGKWMWLVGAMVVFFFILCCGLWLVAAMVGFSWLWRGW